MFDAEVTVTAGLASIDRRRPDLVLLDGNLPDIDGAEVLRRIRSDPATAVLPVVVVSADASAARQAQLLALGANDYLVKPFEIERLGQLVADFTGAAALHTVPTAVTGWTLTAFGPICWPSTTAAAVSPSWATGSAI